ncbi:MAG: IspD/TarI family cytidylyltransferase [Mycobacterium kyogaense]|uniref:IspD/TarI family cytidylyltransferase n=1 Tax=Mycobacterium kyogaense TaxID=2212479 RepID=UPI002FFCA96B
MDSDAVAVVLAAGSGSRVGADGNKAYLTLDGRSMLVWSLDTLSRVPGVARTVLVFRQGEAELARSTVERELAGAPVEFVEGGPTRHQSEMNVLRYLSEDIESGAVDVVLIHDAARPLADTGMFTTAITLARDVGGALPALAVTGLARVSDGAARPLAEAVVRVQTPQAFRARDVLAAYRCAERDGFEGTDTSSCVERYTDVDVHTFPGSAANLKVTYPGDVAVAHQLLTTQNRAADSP